jgi:cell division septal protein FtsQ
MAIARHRKAEIPVTGSRRRRAGRKPRRASLLYILEAIVCLSAMGAFGYAVSTYVIDSPHFQVKTILIDGANVLREETILDAAQVTSSDNALFLDGSGPADRVTALPYVKTAEVSRAYPDTIIIRVEERTPVATLLIHHRAFELDRGGVVLRELPVLSTHAGPLITNVPNLDVVSPGEQLTHEGLLRTLQFWEHFSGSVLANEVTVSEISLAEADMIGLYCDELPFAIRFGESEFLAQMERLNVLWSKEGVNLACQQYLDMRFGQSVVCL